MGLGINVWVFDWAVWCERACQHPIEESVRSTSAHHEPLKQSPW